MLKITLEFKVKSVIVHAGLLPGAKKTQYSHPDVMIAKVGKRTNCLLANGAIDHVVMCTLQDLCVPVRELRIIAPKRASKPKNDNKGQMTLW